MIKRLLTCLSLSLLAACGARTPEAGKTEILSLIHI